MHKDKRSELPPLSQTPSQHTSDQQLKCEVLHSKFFFKKPLMKSLKMFKINFF